MEAKLRFLWFDIQKNIQNQQKSYLKYFGHLSRRSVDLETLFVLGKWRKSTKGKITNKMDKSDESLSWTENTGVPAGRSGQTSLENHNGCRYIILSPYPLEAQRTKRNYRKKLKFLHKIFFYSCNIFQSNIETKTKNNNKRNKQYYNSVR